MTTVEAEWDEQERGWAEALQHVEADTCKGCRQLLSESTGPEAEGAYAAALPTRCHGCTPLAKAREEYAEQAAGLLWQVVRKN